MKTSLNICSWNVGGLLSEHHDKSNDKNFLSELAQNDLVLLTETHVGYENHLKFDNFLYYPFCRPKSKNNRYFGGLGILIRKEIRKGVNFLNNGTSEYQWLKLKREFFNLNKDIYLCLIYYAPKSQTDLLEIIEKDITDSYGSMGDILLVGDLNARTGSEKDYIDGDSTSHVPLFDENYDVDCFTEERVSKDLITDSRGKNLLEFCIGNQLRILNGRMCGDSTGKFTCFKPNGCSVVDYALVSQSLLQQILYFNVSDFKANFSDCHCKITFKILASFQLEKNKSHMKDFPLRYKWDTESIQNFQESFTHPVIQNELKYFLNNKIILDKKNVNDATYSIHSIYEKVCKVSLKKKKKRVKTCNHKKWFDQDLKSLKKHVNDKAVLMSKFPKDPIVRGSFFKLNKQFAKLRRKKKREFRENILDRLSNLESENPKDYWNLVNQLRLENNSETKNNIDGDIWYKYFSDLSSIPENEHIKSKIKEIKSKLELLEKKNFGFSEIDFKITPGELQKALRQLKSGKSPGLDTITNEMLKVSQSYMQDCLLKLFNAILLSGIYPSNWSESYITPIFKSDNPQNPENYRGIAINNSLGKLFNTILYNRLDKFLSDNNIINKTQIGFSKKARTSDHIFVLKCLIEKYVKRGKGKLYVCFVDFRKAFDKVIHIGILYKLLQHTNNGIFYNILKSMYSNDKVCVKVEDKITDFFRYNVGVRQGDVLSPTLFKLFINDLPDILSNNYDDVNLNDEKIPCLLYADDLVLISDSKEGLQKRLDTLCTFCKDWCMEINVKKTKIIIFNRSGRLLNENFNVGNNSIECVKQYKYQDGVHKVDGNCKMRFLNSSIQPCLKYF